MSAEVVREKLSFQQPQDATAGHGGSHLNRCCSYSGSDRLPVRLARQQPSSQTRCDRGSIWERSRGTSSDNDDGPENATTRLSRDTATARHTYSSNVVSLLRLVNRALTPEEYRIKPMICPHPLTGDNIHASAHPRIMTDRRRHQTQVQAVRMPIIVEGMRFVESKYSASRHRRTMRGCWQHRAWQMAMRFVRHTKFCMCKSMPVEKSQVRKSHAKTNFWMKLGIVISCRRAKDSSGKMDRKKCGPEYETHRAIGHGHNGRLTTGSFGLETWSGVRQNVEQKTPVYHTEIVQAVGARSHVMKKKKKEEKKPESEEFVEPASRAKHHGLGSFQDGHLMFISMQLSDKPGLKILNRWVERAYLLMSVHHFL